MSYPRLIERFGKTYSWKMMMNPKCNINERVHAIVGECNAKARETYFKGWKRSMRNRVRPRRDPTFSSVQYGHDMYEEPGKSGEDPKYFHLCRKVAGALSKVHQPQLSEFIKVGKIVGSGIEGVVRPGVNKAVDAESTYEPAFQASFKELAKKFGDKTFAVKSIEKKDSKVRYSSAQDCREVKVLTQLSKNPHPNVTSYLHTFESPLRLHIVSEYNDGGDLFSYLADHDFEIPSEQDAARVMMQLLCAILYCHENGYVHLDLKLENVMRRKKGVGIDEGGVALIDFGHASKIPVKSDVVHLNRPVGSPSYASPEVVLSREYSKKSDVWSLGVIMYILVQGYLPFPHLQQKKWREFSLNDYGNFEKGIEENDPFCYDGDWEEVSTAAKELCQNMLQVDTTKRFTVEEAINHPWFEENGVKMTRAASGIPVAKVMASNQTTREYSIEQSCI